MSRTSKGGWNRGLLGASLLGLGSCTAILDFSEPIDTTDASAAIDAVAAAPDGSPAICSTFEPNETIEESMPITEMGVVSAICGQTDSDVFSFSVGASNDVIITLSLTGDSGDDIDLQLLNDANAVIVDSTGSSNTEQINRTSAMGTLLTSGTYHIAVKPVTVSSLVNYTISLSITAVAAP